MVEMSGSTVHLWSGLLPVLFLAWPPSSTQESLISKWRACRTQTPSSAIMPILGHLPTKTWPVTPTRCVQVSLWRPLTSLPPDTWAQTTHSAAFRKYGCIEKVLSFIFPLLSILLFWQKGFLSLDHPLSTQSAQSQYFSEHVSKYITNDRRDHSGRLEHRFYHLHD